MIHQFGLWLYPYFGLSLVPYLRTVKVCSHPSTNIVTQVGQTASLAGRQAMPPIAHLYLLPTLSGKGKTVTSEVKVTTAPSRIRFLVTPTGGQGLVHLLLAIHSNGL